MKGKTLKGHIKGHDLSRIILASCRTSLDKAYKPWARTFHKVKAQT